MECTHERDRWDLTREGGSPRERCRDCGEKRDVPMHAPDWTEAKGFRRAIGDPKVFLSCRRCGVVVVAGAKDNGDRAFHDYGDGA